MKSVRLDETFYRLSAVEAAPLLLGKLLCRRLARGENDETGESAGSGETVLKCRITETEAYFGEQDSACHASKGKTPRTQVMYRAGGCAYVYLCYGIHNLLNVVTGPENHPEAVLIRAVEKFNGPGKLTKALRVTRALNGEDLSVSQELWLEDDGFIPAFETAMRIGINYAANEDIEKLWRFTVKIDSIT